MPTDRQRREAQRRRLKRQQQRRTQQSARHRRNSLIVSVIGVLIVAGIVASVLVATTNDSSTPAAGGSTTPTTIVPTPTTSVTPPPTDPYPCSWTPSGNAARQVTPPATPTPPKTGKVNMLVSTSEGAMTFQLDRSLAPCAVASFVSLAQQNYYSQTSCHRLTTTGFYVLQCGDPLATGLGGPGYTIPDEATGNEEYPAGTIAMARTANPHSGGSQFFIVYKDSPELQQGLGALQYTVFGKVTSGLNVVDKVAAQGAPNGDGKPNLPLTLNSVALVE
jgi:peptidyl-prolyl cis-trans isomerase B (cyclophilin B)